MHTAPLDSPFQKVSLREAFFTSPASSFHCSSLVIRRALAAVLSAAFCVFAANVQADCDHNNTPHWCGNKGIDNFELGNPGYFDVGGGYTFIQHVNGVNPAASGFMLTIKAYPWGRWYSSKPKVTTTDVNKKYADAAAAPNDTSKATLAAKALQDFLDKQTELFPVDGQNNWYNRFSIFYGRSPGNFDVPTISGSIDAAGFAYDIVPEFAVTVGMASYHATQANGELKFQQTPMFGIQMNLNAFSSFRKLTD